MLFHECDNHMWRLGTRQLQDGIRIDGGSDWICLSREFAQYVANDNDTLLHVRKSYCKYALLPAEVRFLDFPCRIPISVVEDHVTYPLLVLVIN